MAEEAQREGAPGREAEAASTLDPDKLQALQHDILAAARANDADDSTSDDSDEVREPVLQSVQPALRRYTGTKRTERVGPLRFTPEELERLHTAAAAHGYWGTSGFSADVTLAFIDGQFFVDLPLAEERRHTHLFRARVLRHLNKIGHNVNQIARAFNGAYQPHPEFREQLDELRALLTQIAEALRPSADTEEA